MTSKVGALFVDDRFHVVHAAVANFDVILVEKAVVFVLFREVLRNKIEKCSADVSLDVLTERNNVKVRGISNKWSRICREQSRTLGLFTADLLFLSKPKQQ